MRLTIFLKAPSLIGCIIDVQCLGLPTFCFAIPGHLNTGASNLFKPRAILVHQKYWWAKQMKHIAVPAQKNLGGNEVLPKFCDVCPNHDFIVHFGYDKKIV